MKTKILIYLFMLCLIISCVFAVSVIYNIISKDSIELDSKINYVIYTKTIDKRTIIDTVEVYKTLDSKSYYIQCNNYTMQDVNNIINIEKNVSISIKELPKQNITEEITT